MEQIIPKTGHEITRRREIEMVEQAQTNNQTQTKDNRITKANETGILNQSSRRENQYTPQSEAIRRPQIPDEIRYKNEILKTIEKAIIEGKARNTVDAIRHRLIQLGRVADLMNLDDVKKAIGYCKLSNAPKTAFALSYNWFCTANVLKWEKPKYKWNLKATIIPTTDQVNKIISATTQKLATIFKLMAEIGVEGEELHRTHRNQFNPTRARASKAA
jgi:hypothetical protein